jgi:hypothetical protein
LEHAAARLKENAGGIVTRIPVLMNMTVHELPSHLQHIACLDYDDSDAFIDKLVTAISNDIPLTSEIEVNRTGVGLAWSYYYGYLDIILPGLQERIRDHPEFNTAYKKFVIIMTSSCNSPGDIAMVDPNFQHAGNIKFSVSRAGNIARDYSSTIYKFTYRPPPNKDDKASGEQPVQKEVSFFLLMEFATPLLSLYKMQQGGLARLDEHTMWVERNKFKQVVEQILEYPQMNDCKGKTLIVDYRDTDVQTSSTVLKKTTLSEAVWNALQHDALIEQCAASKLSTK